jgi:hypothetical protein
MTGTPDLSHYDAFMFEDSLVEPPNTSTQDSEVSQP